MKITTFNVKNTFSNDGNINMLSGIEAINQCLITMIMTQKNELFGDPEFGSILHEKTYNLANSILKDILKDNLLKLISSYDNRIEVEKIDIGYINQNTAKIDIDYNLGTESSKLVVSVITGD